MTSVNRFSYSIFRLSVSPIMFALSLLPMMLCAEEYELKYDKVRLPCGDFCSRPPRGGVS